MWKKEEWTTMNPVMGEIRLLWVICQNCCITSLLHLCSCCNRRPSISHKFNRPNLNYGVPQWKANICKLAKGESHLLYTVKSHVYMAARKWMPVCSLYMLLIWDSVFPLIKQCSKLGFFILQLQPSSIFSQVKKTLCEDKEPIVHILSLSL